MKNLFRGSSFIVILLTVVSACTMNAPATLNPAPPAAGQAQNNPPPPITILPSAVPPALNPGAASGNIVSSNNGGAGSLIPPCSPFAPSVSQATSFCANKPAGLGGATIILNAFDAAYDTSKATCTADTTSNFKLTCTGAQNTSFQIYSCGSCGGGDKVGSAAYGNYTCASGFVKQSKGNCLPAPSTAGYYACPVGSHYDNTQQYCVDNVTNQKLANLCPAGTVTYLPDLHYCLTKSYPEQYNCQTFTIPLGACTKPVKSNGADAGGACPAGQTLSVNPLTGASVCK